MGALTHTHEDTLSSHPQCVETARQFFKGRQIKGGKQKHHHQYNLNLITANARTHERSSVEFHITLNIERRKKLSNKLHSVHLSWI